MNYSERNPLLVSQFNLGADCLIEDSNVGVRYFKFESNYSYPNLYDNSIQENTSFLYPVFVPAGKYDKKNAILLLHGLNERKWGKYLTWAERLCMHTRKPVILFPIAFHMNRSPYSWSNPREMLNVLDLRRKKNGEDRFLTYMNVALSERISDQPYRFYASGRQSLLDMARLFTFIKEGRHPLFDENTHIDIFAYSIGAFLSQIALMSNTDNLFTDSKLFMFCGGSIFNSMSGKSRSILDGVAFDKLISYYTDDFLRDIPAVIERDRMTSVFCSMIKPEYDKEERLTFFDSRRERIKGVSLKKDTVIPYDGIKKAMGDDYTTSHIQLMDFDYDYSHENPFPTTGKNNREVIDKAFNAVFDEALSFLS